MTRRYFIAGTDTGVGKTTLTEALIRAARAQAIDAIGLKPIETGCGEEGIAQDADCLARASDASDLAHIEGFYRARNPLAPLAATFEGEAPPPPIARLAETIRAADAHRELSFIEAAGGLLVPYDTNHQVADLALELGATLILVAADRLGTLSSTLTAIESAEKRKLPIQFIILSGTESPDFSSRTNLEVLRQTRPEYPILPFPYLSNLPDRIDAAKRILERLERGHRAPRSS